MSELIVALDLGTSHITGIVGEKLSGSKMTVLAVDKEESNSCIRRGIIHNLEETALHVNSLIAKLEEKLNGKTIEKIYIGTGGQSIRTIDHIETKKISENMVVTQTDIDELKSNCQNIKPDLLDVLEIPSPVYFTDGRRDLNPVGVSCELLEAHYKLIVGRLSIRRGIINSIKKTGKEIAKIIVTPFALAEAMLSKQEKELGCALVDIGYGTTTVTIFKEGNLLDISVIPIGGNLITKDIASLQLTESVSENLKIKYGSAIIQKEDEDKVITVEMDGSVRSVGINDINIVVEGRAKELVENIYERIGAVADIKTLGAGIVLAGQASELKNLPELITEKCKNKARHSTIRPDLIADTNDISGNPQYMAAISILLQGTESCISVMNKDQGYTTEVKKDKKNNQGFIIRDKPQKQTKVSNGKGFWGQLFSSED